MNCVVKRNAHQTDLQGTRQEFDRSIFRKVYILPRSLLIYHRRQIRLVYHAQKQSKSYPIRELFIIQFIQITVRCSKRM